MASNSGEAVNNGHYRPLSINSELLWDLLVYETAGRDDETHGQQSIFGPSLVKMAPLPKDTTKHHEARSVEYDLVGSAGISGHKTVPKESPAYAPEDIATPKEPSTALSWSFEDRLVGGIDEVSSYEALLLQPNDFGRAIDEWLNFD